MYATWAFEDSKKNMKLLKDFSMNKNWREKKNQNSSTILNQQTQMSQLPNKFHKHHGHVISTEILHISKHILLHM